MSADLLERLQAAGSDAEREWIVMEVALANLQPDVAEAAWAAAIPHWFDAPFLAALLARPLAETQPIYNHLTSLSFVERFPERGHNIHERTRRLLLDRLWRDDAGRYRLLSRRAADFCARQDQADTSWRIETVYHLLVAEPEQGADELQGQGWTWHNPPHFAYDRVEALARASREHADAGRTSPRGLGWTQFWEALLEADYSRPQSARERFQRIQVDPNTDRYLAADVAFRLGSVHLALAEYPLARQRYEEAYPIYHAIGDRLNEANCIRSLGDVHLRLAEYPLARQRYEEARPIYHAIGDRLGEANCIKSLGDVHLALAEYPLARQRYEAARPIYHAIGDRLGEANCIMSLGEVASGLGDWEAARAAYREASARYHAIGDPWSEANTLDSLATSYEKQKLCERAVEIFGEAIRVYPREPLWLENRAATYLKMGDFAAAETDINAAAELQSDHPYLALRRGDFAFRKGQYDEAAGCYRKALTDLPNLNTGHFGLGLALLCLGQAADGLAEIRRALDLTYAPREAKEFVEELEETIAAHPGLPTLAEALALVRAWQPATPPDVGA